MSLSSRASLRQITASISMLKCRNNWIKVPFHLRMDKFLSRSTVDLYLKTVLWSEKSIFSTLIPGLEELRARRWRWHSWEIFWVLINFVILSCDGGRCRLGHVGQHLDKNHLSCPQHYAYYSQPWHQLVDFLTVYFQRWEVFSSSIYVCAHCCSLCLLLLDKLYLFLFLLCAV